MKKERTEIQKMSTQDLYKSLQAIQSSVNPMTGEKVDYSTLSTENKAIVDEYIIRSARKAQRRMNSRKGRQVQRKVNKEAKIGIFE